MKRAQRKAKASQPAAAPIPKMRGRRFGETLPPIAVEYLVAKLNLTRAALAIGISPGIIHRARKDGFINKPYEVAAWGVLQLGPYQAPEAPAVSAAKKLRDVLQSVQRKDMDDADLIKAIADVVKEGGVL